MAGAARIALWRPVASAGAPADGLHRLLVGIHLHTDADDGRGSLEEVMAAARKAGLDAIVVSDHDTFAHLPREGYHDGLLVLVGAEISTDDGHLLALGVPEPPFPPSYEAAAAIADVHLDGGLAVAAHPTPRYHSRLSWCGPWERLDGIEVVNLDSAWRAGLGPRQLPALAAWVLAPASAITALGRREDAALGVLDRLQEVRPVLASGGLDAHGHYEAAFGTLVDVLLVEQPLGGDLAADRRAVLEALRRRRVLIAQRAIADPSGASFTGRRGGQVFLPGDVVDGPGAVDLRLVTGLEADAELCILHRGEVVASGHGRSLELRATEPGAYRGEVWVEGPFRVPWLLTNAIGLAGADGGWPRPEPEVTVPPVERSPDDIVSLLEELHPEHDPRSSMEVVATVDGGAPARQLEVSYRLAAADADHPNVWCALVSRHPRDLSRRHAIVLRAASDHDLRLDVVMVTVAADGGERRYRRSVRLGPEPTFERLPLVSFRDSDGSRRDPPRLDRVDRIFATLDGGNARPGGGWLRLEALAVE